MVLLLHLLMSHKSTIYQLQKFIKLTMVCFVLHEIVWHWRFGNYILRIDIFRERLSFAGEQKRARKTNLDWKGVAPFAQARDIYNGDSSRFWLVQGLSSNWNARNLWNVILLKCMLGHFWLAVTHAWVSRKRQVTRESEIPKKVKS